MMAWMVFGWLAYTPIVLWRFSKPKKQSVGWSDIIFALPFGPLAWIIIVSTSLIVYPQQWGNRRGSNNDNYGR